MNITEYQRLAQRTNVQRHGSDPIAFYLMGLAGEVGSLSSAYKKRIRDGQAYREFTSQVAQELGDVLWYLAALATELGLDLDDVANRNLERTAARWLTQPQAPTALDTDAPEGQRLPRRFTVRFASDGARVTLFDESGQQLGDRLTDNAHTTDFYRFHDVFHLAHAAVLGWSPLVRSMLGRKRKYDDRVDEVEDGARAVFTEEAVVASVFRFAESQNFFEGVEHVDSEILDLVARIVAGLEVNARSHSEWESAILQAYEAWRLLVRFDGGTVMCDLDLGLIAFEHPG